MESLRTLGQQLTSAHSQQLSTLTSVPLPLQLQSCPLLKNFPQVNEGFSFSVMKTIMLIEVK